MRTHRKAVPSEGAANTKGRHRAACWHRDKVRAATRGRRTNRFTECLPRTRQGPGKSNAPRTARSQVEFEARTLSRIEPFGRPRREEPSWYDTMQVCENGHVISRTWHHGHGKEVSPAHQEALCQVWGGNPYSMQGLPARHSWAVPCCWSRESLDGTAARILRALR